MEFGSKRKAETLSLGRITVLRTYKMRRNICYRCSVVCLCHDREPCKNRQTGRDALLIGMLTRLSPRNHVLNWDTYWRNLANTTELSMCGGDTAFLLNYFDHLFSLCLRETRR